MCTCDVDLKRELKANVNKVSSLEEANAKLETQVEHLEEMKRKTVYRVVDLSNCILVLKPINARF